MGRDIVDIPEVFRRAFEQDEGGDGGDEGRRRGSGNGGGGRGRPWWSNRIVWLTALILVLLLSFNGIVTAFTDWLWFGIQDYQGVWLTTWIFRVVTFAVTLAVAGFVLILNWRVAFRNARRAVSFSRLRILELPGVGIVVTASAAFVAFLFASAAATQWERFLLYVNRVPFGVDDPVFSRDLSFYLFELPVYRFIQGWLSPLFILTLIGVVGFYLVDNWPAVQRGQWRPQSDPNLRRHVALLAAIVALIWAFGYWLDAFELLYSTRGVAFGASYTDLQASLPALRVQLVLAVVFALALALNVFRQEWRPAVITGVLWLLVTVGMANIYPSMLQRYAVEPNELARERPYIEHNIAFTRLAFGLDQVDARPFGDVTELSRQDLAESEVTLQNIRLWDYRPLQQTYAQLQELRPYYGFSSVDIDRYEFDGEVRQVMLAGRELDKNGLTAPSWVNRRLEFTHGYGVVMNPVDQVTPEGRPEFFISDLPPVSKVPIEVERPQIYYGETMSDVVLVGSGLEEFDYPSGNENVYSSYSGQGGVPLSSLLRRLAFSFRFGESNLLLSEYITPQTRVMFHRQILDRVHQITPFLEFDHDPYLVVAGDHLVWMLDAYTLSSDFPYSTPAGQGFNYIRNAVKITIDAYDGDVNYYLAAPEDPIIQAYEKAFPDLFKPLSEMPETLQAHIRYPEGLFLVQTRQYLKYHMTEVQVFYNQEDLWSIAQEVFQDGQQDIEPYYVLLSLPREQNTEYLLIEPYTPAGKPNMVAWMAARSDPENYGQLVVYKLSKQELAFGPIQVEARIDQDPQISAQMSLWNQRGSQVIRGNLLVLPLNNSFLYVEPLYLQAETSELPELKRVIVASGDRIAMRETLDEALLALLEDAPTVAEIDTAGAEANAGSESTSGGETTTGETTVTPTDATFEQLIQSANSHFEAAEAAQRRGDWTTYGRELEALRQDLARLEALSGE